MDDDFLKRLLATFRVEAEEHVQSITAGLIELEQELDPERRAETLETVFREAHSLKGAARAVGSGDVEALCQALEGVFARAKRGELTPSPALFDAAHRTVDAVAAIVAASAGEQAAGPGEVSALVDGLAEAAAAADAPPPDGSFAGGAERSPAEGVHAPVSAPPAPVSAVPAAAPAEPERVAAASQPDPAEPHTNEPSPAPRRSASKSVRISMDKLDDLLAQSEALLALKQMADRTLHDVRELGELFAEWSEQWAAMHPVLRELRLREEKATRADRRRRREDREAARFLELGETIGDHVRVMQNSLVELDRSAEQNLYASRMLVESLVDEVKQLLMLPFSSHLEGFPKLVRDLSRDQSKEVELVVSGEAIEIDRRILEEMRIVFTHLLRNAVDHGIEQPDVRTARGKPPRGTIRIDVHRGDGSSVDIVVSDDGGGIDVESLREASAAQRGLFAADAAEPDGGGVLAFAFQSGVSTSATITDISGRGLGLAIVREKVEKLGGTVAIRSRPGEGTTLAMKLPLTLATFRGVLVSAAGRLFVVPAASVERVVRLRREEVRTVQNREALTLDGVTLPLARLSHILELSADGAQDGAQDGALSVLILTSHGARAGCSVDEIVGEQEVIIKRLRAPLTRVRNVAAVTILGSGGVVPVLDASDLVKSAARMPGPASPISRPAATAAVKKSVLVVEDSITSRMLLKSILEAAGYAVVTAVDGLDAMTHLSSERIDAVVSDVDMPRMNGFDLTEKIRGNVKLEELPVVLVTSLGSGEDRERGIDVGANAYIVKSSFDQSNLLETLDRLV
jgi:two-component system chemotaxis sensor kinase CheA